MQRSGLPESCEFAGQVEGQEGPATLVLGLVLDDDDLGSRVLGQFGRKVRGGQRVVLLQAQDRGLLVAALLPLGLEVVDDLAGRDEHARHLAGGGVLAVREDRTEAADGEVRRSTGCCLQAQHRLRGEDDEWATWPCIGLTTEEVEIGRRRRRIGHGHVVLGAQLEEAFDACRRVVRPLAFVPMRQKKDDRGALTPFLLRAADELVDDGLGTIEEVAELGLPEHQCVRSLDRIAVLEAHRGILRQQGVVDPEAGLALTEVEQGGPLLGGVLVDEHRVPLHEGATTAVLTGQPHGSALTQQ